MRLASLTLAFVILASAAPAHAEHDETALLTGSRIAVVRTSKGPIVLRLDASKAPLAVTNFVTQSRGGYYARGTFHRVIPDFMIQGGDPKGDGTTGESIYGHEYADENLTARMKRGVIATANRGPGTNGSQFFILQAEEATWLEGGYTVFGKVIRGMDVVDKIAAVPRDMADKPIEPVTFSVRIRGAR